LKAAGRVETTLRAAGDATRLVRHRRRGVFPKTPQHRRRRIGVVKLL